MDRNEFGDLVAALREDLGWTQMDLAKYGDLDSAVISQIERGVKKTLPPALLVKLTDALRLTTVERKRFLLAANGIGYEQSLPQSPVATADEPPGPEMYLRKMMNLVKRLRVPAYLADGYSDVLAANLIAFSFFEVPLEMLKNAEDLPGGFNTIRLVFGKDLAMRSHFIADWDEYARSSMSAFREGTLIYRAQPYFKYLFKAFQSPMEYPLFTRFWNRAISLEQDRESNFQIFSYEHNTYGSLKYYASSSLSVNRYGELWLIIYTPVNMNTKRLFDRLVLEYGAGLIRLAPWPVKKILHR